MLRTLFLTAAVLGLVSSANVPAFAGDGYQDPKPGDVCVMVKPHAGEKGWLWSDGQCHHLDVSYDPNSTGNTTATADLAPPVVPGVTCAMTGDHKGETGYPWPDGQCHHNKPTS